MNELLTRTTYRLTVLSPVHVGTGETLTAHDVAVLNGHLWRFEPDRLFEHLADDRRLLDRYTTQGAQALAAWPEERRRACARYAHPWRAKAPTQVREQVADPLGHPYLPGSSIKGAIRTALLWAACALEADDEERAALRSLVPAGGSPKQAGENLQRRLLGPDPNHDLLRALRVEDSTPAPLTQLRVAEVRVAVREPDNRLTWFVKPGHHEPDPHRASAIWAEVLVPRTTLTLSITLDHDLLTRQAARLGFERRAALLERLAPLCNRVAHRLGRGEYEWARACGLNPLVRFYVWLSRDMKQHARQGAIYLWLGWGTGWRSKTVAEALGEEAVAHVRRAFRLGKGPLFPKTRRVVFENGAPAVPLGWVRLVPMSSEQ